MVLAWQPTAVALIRSGFLFRRSGLDDLPEDSALPSNRMQDGADCGVSFQLADLNLPQYCSARGLLPAGILDACRRVIGENGPRRQLTERDL
jgi:hypothetical protein